MHSLAPSRHATAGELREHTLATCTHAGGGGKSVAKLALVQEALPKFGPSFKELLVEATPETASRLHVKIRPAAGKPRYEVPTALLPRWVDAKRRVICKQ